MKDKIIDIFMIALGLFVMIMLGIIVITGVIYISSEISIKRSNSCIENGGIVVINKNGYFESCIRR